MQLTIGHKGKTLSYFLTQNYHCIDLQALVQAQELMYFLTKLQQVTQGTKKKIIF